MRVLLSGTSGLVGSSLRDFLRAQGHVVHRLVRDPRRAEVGDVVWPEMHGPFPAQQLEGVDALVHLAGENIAQGRWTPEKKDRIYRSRVESTRRLAEALVMASAKPTTFLCASAVGYYGDRGDEVLTETSSPGNSFLAKVCGDWEAAANPAKRAGIRTLHLRFGAVLSQRGGALNRMLPAFRLGLGGKLGSGQQYMSWVTLVDCLHVVKFVLENQEMEGSLNVVSPQPLTNEEFTRILGSVLSRPTWAQIPKWLLRRLLGEMADELLLSSLRVHPARLQQAGYAFVHRNLVDALRASLDEGRDGL